MKSLLNFPVSGRVPVTGDAIAVRNDSYFMDVANGRREGVSVIRKFGYTLDLDVVDGQETVWSEGGAFVPLTNAETLSLVSTDVNDTLLGSGARTVRLSGVGVGRVGQTEDIDLNGTTPVVTSLSWLGVNRVRVLTAGSSMTNEGDIRATSSVSSTVQAKVDLGKSTTHQMMYFCPSGDVAQFTQLTMSCLKLTGGTGVPRVSITAHLWDFDNNVVTEVFTEDIDTDVSNNLELSTDIPFTLPGGAMLEIRAKTDVNNTVIRGQLFGIDFKDVEALSTLEV